jgi:hypothetical protein
MLGKPSVRILDNINKLTLKLFLEDEVVSEIIKMPTERFYVSKPTFSPLIGRFVTSICTSYHNTRFRSIKAGMKQTVVVCIDVDLNSFLRIKLNSNEIVDIDSTIPQIDRTNFMVLDSENKLVRLMNDFKLPYTYEEPFAAHIRPTTGVANSTILQNLLKYEKINATESDKNTL